MTNNHHTPIPPGSAANSSVINAPLSQLDTKITENSNNITTLDAEIDGVTDGTTAHTQLRFADATTLTIATGAITITRTNHVVDGEGGAADDLVTISGGDGTDFLIIRCASAARPITVKHNTGNIYLANQQDVVLDDTLKALVFYYDENALKWFQMISPFSVRDAWSTTLYTVNQLLLPKNSIRTTGFGTGNNRPRLDLMARSRSRLYVQEKAAAATFAPFGMAAGTNMGAGASTEENNTDSVYVRRAIAASAGTFGGRQSSTFDLFRRQHNPYFHARIRTGSDVSNLRIWVGMFSAAVTNVDTIAGATEAAAFRFSTVAGDAGWTGITKDATTQSSVATGVGVAVSTAYDLEIWVDSANGAVYFSVNGSTPVSLSANLPQTTTELGWLATAITTTASAKTFDISRVTVEFD